MSYSYQIERPWLFTEDGQVALMKVRDHIQAILKKSGAIMMGNCWPSGLAVADSWKMLALVDRLVEIEDLREINYGSCAGQHRIFVARNLPLASA
jgi:hypothetical protein